MCVHARVCVYVHVCLCVSWVLDIKIISPHNQLKHYVASMGRRSVSENIDPIEGTLHS